MKDEAWRVLFGENIVKTPQRKVLVARCAKLLEDRDATITTLTARVAELEEALEPFANVPMHGAYGGPLVCAQTAYEDGSGGEELGLSPTWPKYIPHEWFSRARAALKGGDA